MKWQKLIAATLVGLLVSAIAFRTANRPPDPEHDGHRLSEWLRVLTDHRPNQNRKEAELAVIAIGTNAMPLLIRELASRDSEAWSLFVGYLNNRNWNRYELMTSERRHSKALVACNILGKDSAKAVSAVSRLLTTSSNFLLQASAARTLGSIGPGAASAVPLLTQTLADSRFELVRHEAAKALGAIGPAATSAIPELTKAWVLRSAVRYFDEQPSDGAANALVALGIVTNRHVFLQGDTNALTP